MAGELGLTVDYCLGLFLDFKNNKQLTLVAGYLLHADFEDFVRFLWHHFLGCLQALVVDAIERFRRNSIFLKFSSFLAPFVRLFNEANMEKFRAKGLISS